MIEPTPALERLLHLKEHFDIPLALAVIPEQADPSLPDHIGDCVVLQHGFCHENFAAADAKKSEFPETRPIDQITEALGTGKGRLESLFGDQFFPLLVPPWNRIGNEAVQTLPSLGFIGLSRYMVRAQAIPAPGLAEVNCHVDPINWRGDRRAVPMDALLDMVIGHLRARRLKIADPVEPTGLLTHHLVHDEDLWAALYKLLAFLTSHPAARWVPPQVAIALIDEMPDEEFFSGFE